MEKKLKRSFYVIPALYFILTALFIYLHYSQRISFSRAIGNIEMTGNATKGSPVQPSEIKQLNMFVNGMNFLFNSSHVLKIRTSDGIYHKSELKDYKTEEDGFTLYFDNDIDLSFNTDLTDNKITVSAVFPQTVPPVDQLTLPFSEDRGYSLGFTEEDNTPVISNGETRYFLALTNPYKVDTEAKRIVIDIPDSKPVNLVIQETLVSKGRTAEKWYEQNNTDLTSTYSEAITTFINNAFFGWNSRFNSKTGKWTDAEGNQQFDEQTAVSYLSESLLRGSYPTSSSLIRTATVPLENQLTALTAPFVGNIVVKGDELITSQNQKRTDIINKIDSKDPSLFDERNLIVFMRNTGLDSRINEVLDLLMKDGDIPLPSRINRLKIINNNYRFYPDRDFNSYITDTVEKHILPAVSWLDEGLFLTEDDKVNVKTSLDAGRELLRAGNLLDNDFYKTVGMEMITSLLAKAGESSFLPAYLKVKENRIESESGSLLPEKIYYDLSDNPYAVKQDPLEDTLGEGSWILTASPDYSIQKTPREVDISINFPKGSIHYFAIKGIKPFVRIYMHGFKWPSDPNFQRYSDGWVYDKTTQTLYVKIKHRVDEETLRILYYNPDSEN